MAFTEPSDGRSKQHFSVQMSLLASLTPQQCQMRGGNTGEETAAAAMLRTPHLKHSRLFWFMSALFLCLNHPSWQVVCLRPLTISAAFCGTCFVNVLLVLLKIQVFDWVYLSTKRYFWAGKKHQTPFISIEQMLLYLKGLFALSEGFHSLLLQGGAYRLWL